MLLAAVLGAGCLPPSVIQYTDTTMNPPPRPLVAKAPADVELFTSGAPARPHVDVALLWVDSLVDRSIGELLTQLRVEGAKKGCDAVVVTNMQIVGYDRGANARIAIATCIAYTTAT
ncbi:MAG TPA: hypothetical protein VGG74_34610 [Kofleriaceae bacterium]